MRGNNVKQIMALNKIRDGKCAIFAQKDRVYFVFEPAGPGHKLILTFGGDVLTGLQQQVRDAQEALETYVAPPPTPAVEVDGLPTLTE